MVLSSLSHLQSGGGENKCVTNTLSVYVLVSHYTEQKYTLLFVFLIFYLSLTGLYSNFGRASGAQTVCQKSTMWIREHGLHT